MKVRLMRQLLILELWLKKLWEIKMTIQYHNPVLLDPSIEGLNIRPDGVYVDVTFGGGGHSKAILNKLNENGRLFGFDQDSDAASNISINGNAINFSSASNLNLTITAINNASIGDIVASANSAGNLQLVSSSGADISIAHGGTAGKYFTSHTDATGATISVGSSVTFKGQIQLTHSSTDIIKISGDDVTEI